MTKIDIVTNLYEKLGFSKRECANIVDTFFEIIKDTLENGDNVKISGFGNFFVRKKKARRGRNPQTGEEIKITERQVLSFRLSQVLKDEINNKSRQ
ncbi:MAG: integration host factor subunit alpha [Syntrophorhabdaceae bacterium]|jgi:integration host factor subunit alpha|nr:integration host factor subunit alpha [Syntrophorhabdaceae bacterium]